MPKLQLPLLAAALCTVALSAHADPNPLPPIDRTMTLPAGQVAPVVGLDIADWSLGGSAVSGESFKAGFDIGLSRHFQLGLVASFPINPGAGFGSVFFNATGAINEDAALRFDAGYERPGLNGSGLLSDSHTDRGAVGFGIPLKIPITPFLAFVSGSSAGAGSINRFVNLGSNGAAAYYGASAYAEGGSDNVIVSYGDHDSGTIIGVNVPFGLMMQPDPHFALTLRAGYSAVIVVPSEGASSTAHFIPIGLDLVVCPSKAVDLGASFTLDGYVAASGQGSDLGGPGYFDLRTIQVWLRFHI